jgi:hypothetical protein
MVAAPAVAVVGAGDRLAGGRRFPTVQLGAVTTIPVGVGSSGDGAVQVSAMATVVAVVTVLFVVDTELAGVSSAVALIAGSLGASGRPAHSAMRGVMFGCLRCSGAMPAGSVNIAVFLGARQERCLYDFALVSAAHRRWHDEAGLERGSTRDKWARSFERGVVGLVYRL